MRVNEDSFWHNKIHLLRKTIDWFLYDNGLRHEKFNALNVVKEGLSCFTVFKAVEKDMINRFNVTSTNTNGIDCAIKTMLKLMFIEMA